MPLPAASLWQGLIVVLFGSLVASGLAWVVGSRLTYMWDERKRRRENDLAALASFHQVYGEWFATWKLWSASKALTLPRSQSGLGPQERVNANAVEPLAI